MIDPAQDAADRARQLVTAMLTGDQEAVMLLISTEQDATRLIAALTAHAIGLLADAAACREMEPVAYWQLLCEKAAGT